MKKIYCEFCGKEAGKNVWNPQRLADWTHNVAKNVVRCQDHKKTSKLLPSCRTFDPITGLKRS